jgi:exodeoxyribonuclease-3
MRIATWNVNSIKQRLDHLLKWLAAEQPDVVCLQETKCVDEAFPRLEIETLSGRSMAWLSCPSCRSRT